MSNPNYANENGTWKNVTNCYVKHNNNWVEADEGWKNINGTWTKFYDKYSTTTTPAPTTTTTPAPTTTTQDPAACASTVYAWGFQQSAFNGTWLITSPVQYHDARPVYTRSSYKLYYSIANSRWEIGSTLGGTPTCYASTSSSTCPYGSWTCNGTVGSTTTTTPAPTTTTTSAPTTTTGYPTTTSTSTSTTEDPGEGDGGEGGTTTAGPGGGGGNNVSVTDCSGGTYIVDDYNMMTAGLSVGDIVAWSEGAQGGGGDYHCGTVAATGVSGTSTGTLDMDGFSDCAECNEYMGL